MSDIGKAYVQIVPTAKGISGKIEKELGGAGRSAGQSFSTSFGSVLKGAGKIASLAVSAASTAVGGIVKSAVSSFGEYEQLAGGVEKIFDGMDTSKIINDASKAYKDLGLSANQYLATINDVGATFASTMGAEAGYNTAKKGLQAISDYASGTGKDVDLLSQKFTMITRSTSSYQSIADQFSGILPATSAAFLEQAQNAGILEKKYKNLTEVPIDKYQQAVTEMLGKGVAALNLTGNTAAEAEGTFTGSLAMMQGAWSNLMTGMASDSADLPALINNLVESATAFAGNAMPMVQQALTGISALISQIAPIVASELPTMITSILPGLLSSGIQIVQTLAQGILQAIPQLMPAATNIIMQLIQVIVGMLPQMVTVGVQVISELVNGISQALPTLLPMIAEIIPQIIQTLIDNAPLLIQSGIQLVQSIADGLLEALPVLIDALPQLVQSLVDALVTNLPMLIEASITLVNGIVAALPTIIQALLTALPTIIDSVTQGLIACMPQLVEGCIQLTAGIVAALPQITAALIAAMPQIIASMAQAMATGFPLFIQEITRLITTIRAQVRSFGTNLLQQVGQNLAQLIQTTIKWLGQLPNKAAYYAGAMVAQFINTIRSLPQKLQQIWNQVLNSVKSFGQKLVAEGPKMAKEFIEKLVAGFKGIGEKLLTVGKDIVEGLKKGIKDSWTGMTDWIKELAADLIKGFKDNLKIKSPSRVMAEEVGKFIPMGIAQGIRDGIGYIDEAISDVSTNLTATAGATFSGDMSGQSYSVATSANGDVYALLSTYLPVIANKEVNIKLEGGMDRFFRAMQTEARRNYQLTGAAL